MVRFRHLVIPTKSTAHFVWKRNIILIRRISRSSPARFYDRARCSVARRCIRLGCDRETQSVDKFGFLVIPAEAGIQSRRVYAAPLDSGHRNWYNATLSHQPFEDLTMKKPTIFAVCVLMLLGGTLHFYLTAQTREAERNAFVPPVSAPPFDAPTPLANSLPAFEPVQVQRTREIIDPGGERRVVVETVIQPRLSRATPNVGMFRIPIDYKLTNIPVFPLMEFLAEQFCEMDVSVAYERVVFNDTEMITITASLDNHRIILRVLAEIEREVEAIRNEAAGVKTPVVPSPQVTPTPPQMIGEVR